MEELKKAQAARHGAPLQTGARSSVLPTLARLPMPVASATPPERIAAGPTGLTLAIWAARSRRGWLLGALFMAALVLVALVAYWQLHASPTPALQAVSARQPPLTALQVAEAAWQRGELAAARMSYEQHLREQPADGAALQGLARVVMREAAAGKAARQAAMAELQALQQRQPRLGYLYYALGHVHAADGQWSLARAEFQHALALEPLEPDYLYNLAVSLDQLQQHQPALQFYRLAQAAARERGASFDQAQLDARLAALQR